jgi:hypothetical protein
MPLIDAAQNRVLTTSFKNRLATVAKIVGMIASRRRTALPARAPVRIREKLHQKLKE